MPVKTLPLATRIAKEIVEQARHDGEIDERWMADWIEQEAIEPLLEVLKNIVARVSPPGTDMKLQLVLALAMQGMSITRDEQVIPPVVCSQCDATADTVLEMSKHWGASGHRGCRVTVRRKEPEGKAS